MSSRRASRMDSATGLRAAPCPRCACAWHTARPRSPATRASSISSFGLAYTPGMYCRPVEKPTAPSAIPLNTSTCICSNSVTRRIAFQAAHDGAAHGVVPDERREVHRDAGVADALERVADVQRRRAAVARHDRRDAHADEVLRQRLRRQVVGVRVDVDESRREHEPRGVQTLRPSAGAMRPIRTMRPSRMPTSPARAGAPVPSTMRALVMTRSNGGWACADRRAPQQQSATKKPRVMSRSSAHTEARRARRHGDSNATDELDDRRAGRPSVGLDDTRCRHTNGATTVHRRPFVGGNACRPTGPTVRRSASRPLRSSVMFLRALRGPPCLRAI